MRTLFIALMLLAGTGLIAQQKYEYASLVFNPGNGVKYRLVLTDDKGVQFPDAGKIGMQNQDIDFTPAFKCVKKMEDAGWELFNTQVVGSNNSTCFFLRKKRY